MAKRVIYLFLQFFGAKAFLVVQLMLKDALKGHLCQPGQLLELKMNLLHK